MKRVIRYQCDSCNKLFSTLRGVSNHELHKCWHKPEQQTCFTCGLFVDLEVENDFGKYFEGCPHCQDEHDMTWQDSNGTDHYYNMPHRQFECPFWEGREDYPGEYQKYRTGLGGYRKICLVKKGA